MSNLNRKIIHIDMDCFYAAVEVRDNPSLRGQPIAVGGRPEQRGVVATCNYEARAFGVRSAMATGYALKLCPELILVPGRMSVYREISQQIRQIFARYTELIEPLSLDEAYLDVTACTQHQGSATYIAQAIRAQIFAETGLTASAGIAPVKFLAKIASDLNKPNGQYVIPPAQVAEFVKTLPLKKIPGVGKVTTEKLKTMGLETCQDVQQTEPQRIMQSFGKFGQVLLERVYGIDPREVQVDRIRKSVGVETTLLEDIQSAEQVKAVIQRLLPELEQRYQRGANGRAIHKQVVKLKFSDFKQTTVEHRSDQLSPALFDELLIQALARAEGRSIRLVGISLGLEEPKTTKLSHRAQLQFGF